MNEQFKRWLDLVPSEEGRLCPASCWEPAADVFQTDDGWMVKFDLSGVRLDDLQIAVSGRRLTIAGTRRDHSRQEGARYYSMEIAYSAFRRTIELPGEIDPDQVTGEFQDGMLLVKLIGGSRS